MAQPALDWQLVAKRVMDIMGASVGLLLFSPVFAVIALLVKFSSPGPVFYRWKVLGQNKRPFTGYKFRTMFVDADQRKAELLGRNEMR